MSSPSLFATALHLPEQDSSPMNAMPGPIAEQTCFGSKPVSVTEQLFHHIGRISAQRDRSQLELHLVDALRSLLGADNVRLYKLFTPKGDCLVGLAAEADASGSKVLDDGLSWPAGTDSIKHFPILQACLMSGESLSLLTANTDRYEHAFPIQRSGLRCFGFLVIEHPVLLATTERNMVEGLISLFCNCQALLDYSEVDSLTGLLNRKTFDESLIRILSSLHQAADQSCNSISLPRRRRELTGLKDHWLGVIDIDNFKRINDSFGHLIGDEVLLMIANMMKLAFRAHDKLFRFGGEEFVVVLKPTEAHHALATFERFRRQIDEHVFPHIGRVSVSIGFARIGVDDLPSMIIDHADTSLYWAKEHGRNQVFNYEDLLARGALNPKPASQNANMTFFSASA